MRSEPTAVAIDGANMWVANNGDGTVTKLRASDGKRLGTLVVPGSSYRLAFDGVSMWVSTPAGLIFRIASHSGTITGRI